MTNHYETLGVSTEASRDEIQAAYKALVRKHHDHGILDRTERSKAISETIMKAANEAWGVLQKEASRDRYDRENKFGKYKPAGFEIKTDGTIRRDGAIEVVFATSTIITGKSIKVEISGKHLIRGGVVCDGTVTLNGRSIMRNSSQQTILSDLNADLGAFFMGQKSSVVQR